MSTTRRRLERDFNALWNTGYFDDLRFEREQTPKGWIIYVYVKEKPTIREIKYDGLNSFSQSDLLDKFKERKVGISQESQFDPTAHQEGGGRHQGDGGGPRTPVCHRPHRSASHSSSFRRRHLHHQRRPEG